jgi:hypothetical protein
MFDERNDGRAQSDHVGDEPMTRRGLAIMTLLSLGFGLAVIVRAFVAGA